MINTSHTPHQPLELDEPLAPLAPQAEPETDTCAWLIEVASNNPEPDFPEDLYPIVECGGKVVVNEHGSWRCEYGHEHVSFSDPARGAYEAEMACMERMAR
jgi:hypothetical protein